MSSLPIFIGLAGIIAKKKYKSKLILDVRDLWPESLKGVNVFNNKLIISIFKLLERKLYEQPNHIIINSLGFLNIYPSKIIFPQRKFRLFPTAREKVKLLIKKAKKQVSKRSNDK
ncbi:glycosyl transferase group 1 protein [Parageobacillus genomosp. 1]|uniref:Glycosyl transferase group 1 protein n=1 Tax=Parageobacillus genomosp. 1 TaxID=1295642 RepID=A0ABC9VAS8_9BACL|nr:glycosyl transferase group 1 protein [Parageobacillus genomosp. 1]